MPFPVKVTLKNEDRGQTVPNGFPLGPAHPPFEEGPLGRDTGQPLVPGRHRDRKGRLEGLDEGKDLFGLGAGLTIQPKGEANHHLAYPLLGHKVRERLQIASQTLALEGRAALGRDPKLIADGQTDGSIPYVQG